MAMNCQQITRTVLNLVRWMLQRTQIPGALTHERLGSARERALLALCGTRRR